MEHAERMAVYEDRTPEEAAAVAPSEPSEPHGAPQLERLWAQLELLGQVDHPSAGACVRNTPPAAPRTPWRARASALGLRARPKIPSPQRFRDNTACVRVARVPVTHGRPDTSVPCVASASGSPFASKPYVEPPYVGATLLCSAADTPHARCVQYRTPRTRPRRRRWRRWSRGGWCALCASATPCASRWR